MHESPVFMYKIWRKNHATFIRLVALVELLTTRQRLGWCKNIEFLLRMSFLQLSYFLSVHKKAWQIGWPSVYLSARHLWFHQTLIMANNSSILSNCSPWSNQLSNNPMEVIIITVTRNFSSWKTIESSTWSRLIMIGAVPLWHWPKRMTAQIFHMTEKTKNMILVITNAN